MLRPIYRRYSLHSRWRVAENSAVSVLEKRKFCGLCRDRTPDCAAIIPTELFRVDLPAGVHREPDYLHVAVCPCGQCEHTRYLAACESQVRTVR
jgi:hypothetical protein